MKRLLALAIGIGCASAPPAIEAPREPPRWVAEGVDRERYPADRYLTAFADAEGANAAASAKLRAQVDIGKQVSIRIKQETSDASIEKDGAYAYELAAMTYAATDVRVSNVQFETYSQGGRVFVLAAVEKSSVAEEQAARRDRAIEELRRCIAAAAETDELRAHLACRAIVPRAYEHDAVVRAFGGSGATGDLIELAHRLEETIGRLTGHGPRSLEEAADLLAAHLVAQSNERARIVVAPLTYGTTPFSSQFGRALGVEIERALAEQAAAESGGSAELVVRGTYSERSDGVRIVMTLRNAATGELVGGAGTTLARPPSDLGLKPQNFQEALQDQRLLAAGEQVSGKLRVEVWTNRGDQNLVFREGEPIKIFLRVNRPAYVRLVYLLANRAKVPIEQAYYIDASKVNLAVEYPATFRVSPPFGAEQLYAVAFTEKPPPLPTVERSFGSETYDVIADAETLVRHRGIKRVGDGPETAESIVSLTTTP
jgi:hypothetical protein